MLLFLDDDADFNFVCLLLLLWLKSPRVPKREDAIVKEPNDEDTLVLSEDLGELDLDILN